MKYRMLSALALLCAASAFGVEITCSAQLAVTAQAREVPAGWEAFQPAEPHLFDRVSVYYLHPREMGSQVPDNEGTKEPPAWIFAERKSEEYWLACAYHGTDTLLAQRLPKGLARCATTQRGVRCR